MKTICKVNTDLPECVMTVAGYEVQNETGTDCGVSGSEAWQQKEFYSLLGDVTAVSFDTGRVVNTDILPEIS